MKYYTIQNNNVLIAENKAALTRFYDNVFVLPEDYEPDKYIIGEKEVEIDVPEFETETVEAQIGEDEAELRRAESTEGSEPEEVNAEATTGDSRQERQAESEQFQDRGNPIYEQVEKQVPIMIEVEETITVIDYDDDGNPTGEHEETITKQVQKTHKETVKVNALVLNPDYEEIKAEKEKEKRISEIKRELEELDLKSLRSLRAIAAGTSVPADAEKLAQTEAEAVELRRELGNLI